MPSCARWGISGALLPAIRYSGAEFLHENIHVLRKADKWC